MALYEDKCHNLNCQAVIETSLSISGGTLVLQCPYCEQPLTRLISSNTFHLKGGNWASENYNGKGKKK